MEKHTIMSETFSDLMSEYDRQKETAKRLGDWTGLDTLAERLITQVVPKIMKPATKFQEYSFDDMGTPILQEDEQ